MSVSVCLSVCSHTYLENTCLSFTKSLCILPSAVHRSSLMRRCDTLYTSGFVDDVILQCWHTTRDQEKDVYSNRLTRNSTGPGTESDVYDYPVVVLRGRLRWQHNGWMYPEIFPTHAELFCMV